MIRIRIPIPTEAANKRIQKALFSQFDIFQKQTGIDFSIRPLTLSFKDDCVERRFLDSYFKKNLQLGRACHVIAIFFYCLFGIWDTAVIDSSRLHLWIIVVTAVTALFLTGLTSSYVSYTHYSRYWRPLFAFYVLMTGAGFTLVTVLARPGYPVYNFVGIIFCLLFCYSFIRLSFPWAAASGTAILILYFGCIWIFIAPPAPLLLTEFFYLSGINFLGMMICYSLEILSRRDFMLNCLLETEQAHVKDMNARLEQRVAERTQALKLSEETFSGFFNQGNIGMAITSMGKGWVQVNQKLCRMLGYTRKELLDKTWTEMTHPDDLEPDLALFNKMAAGDIDRYEMEKRFLKKDQNFIYTHLTVACTRNSDGSIERVMATIQDISEKKASQQRIHHLNRVLKAIRDVNQLIVKEKKPERLIKEACELLVKHRGYDSALLMLTDDKDRIVSWASSGFETHPDLMNRFTKSHGLPLRCHNLSSDNKAILIENGRDVCRDCPLHGTCAGNKKTLLAPLIHDGTGFGYLTATLGHDLGVDDEEIGLFSEMVGDIGYALNFIRMEAKHEASERKGRLLQNQLTQAQKMESIGRLAGGVAHDYNNISSIIIGYSELALDISEPDDPRYDDLMQIHSAAKRSTEITRQLLAFARQQTISPRVLNLNASVEGMIKMLRRLIGEDIDLVWLPGDDLERVKIDPSQVDQILVNLCVNARDAIADVGKITIETDNARLDETYCSDHAGVLPGRFVRLAVSDDGRGIPSEDLDKIFEPFFTTKGIGKGTGLGLATVYGIVKQNDGFINVYSEPEKGTTFRIYLPGHVDNDDPMQPETDAEMPAGGGESILIVEDDRSILRLVQRILTDLGYDVLSSQSPVDALRLVEAHDGKVHLLITDVVMPEMNGRELSEKLQAISPDLKTLFMSGYTANVIAHHGVLEKGVAFIAKPFSKKEMAFKVRQVLDGSAHHTLDE